MPYDPDKHDRQSIRLPGWDYRCPAAYFVTVCTHDRVCIFGEVIDGRMALNTYGRIVVEEWRRTEQIRDRVVLDAFMVMPNHVHGVIVITADGRASTDDVTTNRRGTGHRAPTGNERRFGQPRSGSLSTIVGAFKSAVTRRINRLRDTPGDPVWQRNFYERIARNQRELDRIRTYIRRNPARWHRDRHRPNR
jgi:REP element-mobilizing transposase RayT